jgi:hypothetical protein
MADDYYFVQQMVILSDEKVTSCNYSELTYILEIIGR